MDNRAKDGFLREEAGDALILDHAIFKDERQISAKEAVF